jgi:phosphoribosyl 1,2-cyclic phosphodiesterase
MLQFASLNSGSNGNCYYVGHEEGGILIDAGISFKQIRLRLEYLGIDLSHIRALFISHEHRDHIMGVRVLAKKLGLPVYITQRTLQNARMDPYAPYWVNLHTHQPVEIAHMSVMAFPKYHDAADPHSFVVESKGKKVGIITDIGQVCDQVARHFTGCDAAILESNYDPDMLENGRYPLYLKERIRGGEGHLSNDQAYALYEQHGNGNLQHLVLGHLSDDNNHPERVREVFDRQASATNVHVASRYEPSMLFEVQ